MSTGENKQNQREEWQQRITQWKASGTINAAEWCRKHEINIDHFYYWKSRLTKKSLTSKDFVELSPVEAPSIQLECNGVRIHLETDFDPILLARCISLLKGSLCSK
jgi:predicted methyltransferase